MIHRIFGIRILYPEGMPLDRPIESTQMNAHLESGRDLPPGPLDSLEAAMKCAVHMATAGPISPNRIELVMMIVGIAAHAKRNLPPEEYRRFLLDCKDTLNNPYNNLKGSP